MSDLLLSNLTELYHSNTFAGLTNVTGMTKILKAMKVSMCISNCIIIVVYADDFVIFAELTDKHPAALNAIYLYCKR